MRGIDVVCFFPIESMKKIRYWLEWFFVSIFARLIPMLPLSLVRYLADLAGWVVYVFDRHSRAVALANLEAAFGPETSVQWRRQVTKKSLQVFARSFLELFWTPCLNRANLQKFISFENPEGLPALIVDKKPIIAITPHFANFEWGSAFFAFCGHGGYILTQRFKNDLLTPIFQRLRETSGQHVVTQEASVIGFLKVLRKGSSVGILIDLTLKMNDPAVIIQAFGLQMRTTMIHAFLHERTGIPIVPTITLPRTDGGYFVRVLDPLHFPAGTPYQAVAQACWDRFEPIIREHPEQWLWVYKHWRYLPSVTDRRYPFYANRSVKFDRELETQQRQGA